MTRGLLLLGDCLERLDDVPGELDLVYVDPPYGTGTHRRARGAAEIAYRDPADVDALIPWLCERLARIRERMAPHATLWLHMDHRAVHEAKVGADRVFGRRGFLGEIVWEPGNGARGARKLAVTHQTILVYARAPRAALWRGGDPELREPFAAGSLGTHFRSVDAEGRRYRERTVAGRTYRYYADEGRARGSVWADIPGMVASSPVQAEATGYPTQKPERLLERVVRASSEEGMTVLDPMCGSGTTCVAAAKLGRRFAGIDRSGLALDVAARRLEARGLSFTRG